MPSDAILADEFDDRAQGIGRVQTVGTEQWRIRHRHRRHPHLNDLHGLLFMVTTDLWQGFVYPSTRFLCGAVMSFHDVMQGFARGSGGGGSSLIAAQRCWNVSVVHPAMCGVMITFARS